MPKYFHAISFTGVAGWGTGVLVFDTDSNLVVGADSGGVIYDGQFTVEHGRLTARVQATVPAGTALVTGVPPSNQPSTFTVNISIPMDDMLNVVPVDTPVGPVRIQLRQIRAAA